MKKFLKNKLENFIFHSQWYNDIAFKDCVKFWEMNDEQYDIVNLGSSSGSYDFNYNDVELSGANWAVAPQTMVGDFAVLKQYRKNIKERGWVIYPMCPFTSISGAVDYVEDRCYTFLDFNLIPNAHYLRLTKEMNIKNNPLAYYPLSRLKADIRYRFGRRNPEPVLSEQQLQDDAEKMMSSWKEQFQLTDLSQPFVGRNKQVYEAGIVLLKEIVDYCAYNDFRLVIVIPPVYKTLAEKFSHSDRENLIDGFIRKGINADTPYYNMMADNHFINDRSLFRSSYYLNKKGAALYTSYLINLLKQK